MHAAERRGGASGKSSFVHLRVPRKDRAVYKHILIGALFLGAVPACSSEGGTGSEVTRTGSVRMALEASGASGTHYRLDAATFEIVGPTSVTVSSETDE